MAEVTREEMGFEVARLRGELELLRYENECLRTELNRAKVDCDQLMAQNEAVKPYRDLYVVACEELEECEGSREELRCLVCARSDQCIDFKALIDAVDEHWNPDD